MTTTVGSSDQLQPDKMHVVHARAAGLDVHKMQITASVRLCQPGGGVESATREFSTVPAGLAALTQWLASHRVTAAALEGTGIFWKAPLEALEDDLRVASAPCHRPRDASSCGSKRILHGNCLVGGSLILPNRLSIVMEFLLHASRQGAIQSPVDASWALDGPSGADEPRIPGGGSAARAEVAGVFAGGAAGRDQLDDHRGSTERGARWLADSGICRFLGEDAPRSPAGDLPGEP